jgi:hypothetical protein
MPDAAILDEIRERLRLAQEYDSENRNRALEDFKFSALGEQWPPELQTQRDMENRPCLTINWTDSLVRQVTNSMRQQRPRMKVHPINDGADQKIAEVIQGLMRHIEVNSSADTAYDTAADHAVRAGGGYWRIVTKYEREDSFNQDIYLKTVNNPFSVYVPPTETPDGSDWDWAIITDKMTRVHFQAEYPGADAASFRPGGYGDSGDWVQKDEIRLAEYYKLDRVDDKLLMMSDGSIRWRKIMGDEGIRVFNAAGIHVVADRDSYRKQLKWYKVGGSEELDSRTTNARFVPLIPVWGYRFVVDGKYHTQGMVRNLRDPAISYNYFRTNEVEIVALQPKAPYVGFEGQFEGHEDTWRDANRKPFPYLETKPVYDQNGQLLPPPTRGAPPQVSPGILQASQSAAQDMRNVSGIYSAGLGEDGNERSGKALTERQRQNEVSNYHFYDNWTRAMCHSGRVILDLIPVIYDVQRVVRILGEDGKPKSVTLNQKQPQNTAAGAIMRVLNDVTVGNYDVVMDVGPGYDTKREEAAEQMTDLMRVIPQAAQVGADILVRNLDWPGAEQLADRLEASNPLAQIDKSLPDDVPGPAKALIAHLQQQVQQMQHQLQMAGIDKHFGLTKQKMIEDTKRLDTMVRSHTELEREQIEDDTWRHDIAVKADTAIGVEHIRAAVQLIGEHLGINHKIAELFSAERQSERQAQAANGAGQ